MGHQREVALGGHRRAPPLVGQARIGCPLAHALAARWLLRVDDRVDEARFKVTQEFLAQMIGVQRPALRGPLPASGASTSSGGPRGLGQG